MREAAGEYEKLTIRQYPARSLRETAEGKFWKEFKSPALAPQIGAVNCIDFSPEAPHHFAVTSATRVIVYDALTRQVRRTLSRFKDRAYSGTFRSDGKLLVAGCENGTVQIHDVNSRSVLRSLKAHKSAAHVAKFSEDKVHVLSAADDATVRLWDISTGQQVCRLDGHADYVRCAASSPSSGDIWATGGYDHILKLWDVREKECQMSLDHGAAIESVVFLPSGSAVVTAGSTWLCVWDLLGGGRLLRKIANHQKTVTCMTVATMSRPDMNEAPRLVTGALDGHLKVYDLDSWKVHHVSSYPSPILSVGLSPSWTTLAVGMADGMLCIRKHAKAGAKKKQDTVAVGGVSGRRGPRLTANNYRYFIRGQNSKAAEGEVVLRGRRRIRLAPYDKMLQKFRYREALDAALSTHHPDVICSLLEELAARGGIATAIGGRDLVTLPPLLQFVGKYLRDPRHSRLLGNIAHRLLDTYAPLIGAAPEVDAQLIAMRDRIVAEIKLQQQLKVIQGCLEPILALSSGMT